MTLESTLEIPALSREEIVRALEALLGSRRGRYLFAFLGRGVAQTLTARDSSGERSFEVVPVESELDLRMKLPELDENDPHRVYLVPFVELPRDVRGLFALRRVERVGKDERLAALLGCRAIESGLSRSPLGELILAGRTTVRPMGVERVVSARGLVHAWMSELWGLPTIEEFGRDAMLAWAASNRGGAAFQAAFGTSEKLLEQIQRELSAAAGLLGRVAFHAWREGRGERLLELAVLAEPGRALTPHGPFEYWLKGELKLLGLSAASADEISSELGAVVSTSIAILRRTSSDAFVRARVDAADDSLRDGPARAQLATASGDRLALHHEAQTVSLADAFERVAELAAGPDLDTIELRARLRQATAAFQVWTRHELARRSTERMERAEDALRLAIFLESARRDERLREDSMGRDLARLSRWYVDHGGYVDRARHAARGPSTDRLGVAIERIIDRVDAMRVELDRRFSRALAEWSEAGRRRSEVMGIEDAMAHVAKPFLEVADDRRLLVILLDGMSWSEATELLDDLTRDDGGWGPIHYNRKCARDGDIPAVLAALPTITEISRSAFFAGKRMESGEKHETRKDPERFAANKALSPFFSGTRAPRLFLRAEAQTKAGALANEVITAIGDREQRVVGVVLNTIDDSLKNNPSQRQRWNLAAIAPLRDLLTAARGAGRYVMLASDHGHVKSARLATLDAPTEGEGRRWRRYVKDRTSLAVYERAFSGGGVWTPKGADGVILLVDDTGRYGSAGTSGEHGGATLAEVLTPTLILGWEEPAAASGDRRGSEDLALLPRYQPAFWRLRVDEEASPTRPERKKKDSRQMMLDVSAVAEPLNSRVELPEAAAPPSVTGTTDTPPPSESRLARSTLFKQQVPDAKERTDLLRALVVLEARGGRVPADVFAQEMKYLPHRVASLVAALGEKLALDGMQPLKFDRASGQVLLDLGLLKVLYDDGH